MVASSLPSGLLPWGCHAAHGICRTWWAFVLCKSVAVGSCACSFELKSTALTVLQRKHSLAEVGGKGRCSKAHHPLRSCQHQKVQNRHLFHVQVCRDSHKPAEAQYAGLACPQRCSSHIMPPGSQTKASHCICNLLRTTQLPPYLLQISLRQLVHRLGFPHQLALQLRLPKQRLLVQHLGCQPKSVQLCHKLLPVLGAVVSQQPRGHVYRQAGVEP